MAGGCVRTRRRRVVPGVLRSAGIKLPVQPGKGYGLDFTPSPVQLHRSIYLADHKVAVTPLDRGVRICGTMEFTGIDYSIDAVRAAAIARAARPVPGRMAEGAYASPVGEPKADDA